MNFRIFILMVLVLNIFPGCEKSVVSEFGTQCEKIHLKTEKTLFKSDVDGSFTFQIEESFDKSSGYLMIGSFSEAEEGERDLVFRNDKAGENYMNTIYLFSRNENEENFYRADSGKIDIEYLYRDTKGRILFIRGSFLRLVLSGGENKCKVIEKVDFVFY
jgi:hypothetical protein